MNTLAELEVLLKRTEESTEKFRNSYFWSPPSGASSRRSYEAKNSWDETLELEYQAKSARARLRKLKFEVIFTVSCSCKNVYVKKGLWVNSHLINLTKFRGIVSKMQLQKSLTEKYLPFSDSELTESELQDRLFASLKSPRIALARVAILKPYPKNDDDCYEVIRIAFAQNTKHIQQYCFKSKKFVTESKELITCT